VGILAQEHDDPLKKFYQQIFFFCANMDSSSVLTKKSKLSLMH